MSIASLVLVINCGSSSLKFALIPFADGAPVLSGLAEKLGLDEACMTIKDHAGNKSSQILPEARAILVR